MIAIISDIHGNYPALEAVLNELDHIGCKRIISLGDVAGYYCMVNDCISALRDRNVPHIRGNHDHYLLSGDLSGRSKSADQCIMYQKSIILPQNLEWLQSSLDKIEFDLVRMVHGGWNDHLEEYLYSVSEQYFDQLDGQYFFSGHSHVQFQAQLGNKMYCNPGSIGQPRDGDPRAAYVLFHENKQIDLKRCEYDIGRIAFEMDKSGFKPYFYENLYSGTRIGGGISSIKVVEANQ